ncbi:MAG TPA: hypothetical protein VJY15_02700 [Candidatus Acidoferrum sp.]|nr:hypothetical protein [Candidatus Acidoferrum sp.]
MENHACPLCFAKVPRTLILTKTLDLICPACHAELEVSRGSRVLASFVGVLAAFVAVPLGERVSGIAAWTLPLVAAVMAYGICAALVLFVFSELSVRPKISPTAFPHIHA